MFKVIEKVLTSTDPEPLTSANVYVSQALIQVKRDNENTMMLGDANVTSAIGIEILAPEDDSELPCVNIVATGPSGNNFNLAEIYLLGTSGEGVNILYEVF